MKFQEIYSDITNSFGALWQYKERGNTLEIITPFATTNNRFISVFIKQQGNEFIISDGGWIENFEYEIPLMLDDNCFSKIYSHYLNAFGIQELTGPTNKIIFYKKASKQFQIPSMVFDMANFICSVVSASSIEFVDKEERESKERFRALANNFISGIIVKEELNLKGFLDNKRDIKIDAIIVRQNKLSLVNYITGVNAHYFNNSVFKSYYHFDLANSSAYKNSIKDKYVLVNNLALGYVPVKVASTIRHLEENTNTSTILWSEREKLTAAFSSN